MRSEGSWMMPTDEETFRSFCHINEYGEKGYRHLHRMIAASSPLVLWAPSSVLLYDDRYCRVSPADFVDFVENHSPVNQDRSQPTTASTEELVVLDLDDSTDIRGAWVRSDFTGNQWPFFYAFGAAASRKRYAALKKILSELPGWNSSSQPNA
jgi:hypothetical protein